MGRNVATLRVAFRLRFSQLAPMVNDIELIGDL
jgi:hypothetical protein